MINGAPGKIFRGVFPDRVLFFKELFASGLLQAFANRRMMPGIELIEAYSERYPLIFEIEVVPVFPSAVWTIAMLRDVALNKAIIKTVLDLFNYTFCDGHTFNDTFKSGRPMFFDFGSIVSKRKCGDENFKMEYFSNCVLPLVCRYMGYDVRDYDEGCEYIRAPRISRVSPLVEWLIREFRESIRANGGEPLALIADEVFDKKNFAPECIDILFPERAAESQWSRYGRNVALDLGSISKLSQRMLRIIEMIGKYSDSCESVLDLAGNAGYLSHALSRAYKFKSIVNSDNDEGAIDLGRKAFSGSQVDFMRLNLVAPPPERVNASDVFNADIVLALAVTHHLIITNHYDLDGIFNAISRYATKFVFIEFMPLGLFSADLPALPTVPEWYGVEWFQEHFKRHFTLIHREVVATVNFKGNEYDHRVLFIGAKTR
jgi:hypothetical protein